MAWHDVDESTALNLLNLPGTHYILFYASGSPPWCSDCRDAEPNLKKAFASDHAPQLNVVRVGSKEQWKPGDAVWRTSAYHIRELPTLIKLVDVGDLNMPEFALVLTGGREWRSNDLARMNRNLKQPCKLWFEASSLGRSDRLKSSYGWMAQLSIAASSQLIMYTYLNRA